MIKLLTILFISYYRGLELAGKVFYIQNYLIFRKEELKYIYIYIYIRERYFLNCLSFDVYLDNQTVNSMNFLHRMFSPYIIVLSIFAIVTLLIFILLIKINCLYVTLLQFLKENKQ